MIELDAAKLLAMGAKGLEKVVADARRGSGGLVLVEDGPHAERDAAQRRNAEEVLEALAQAASPGAQAKALEGGRADGYTVFVVTGTPAGMAGLFERHPLLAASFQLTHAIPSFGAKDLLEFLCRYLKVRRTVGGGGHHGRHSSVASGRPGSPQRHDSHGFVHFEDERHARIAVHRIIELRETGESSETNIGAVKDLADAALRRMRVRVDAETKAGGSPDPALMVRDDLLGPKLTRVRRPTRSALLVRRVSSPQLCRATDGDPRLPPPRKSSIAIPRSRR